jgi:hypothetical protein
MNFYKEFNFFLFLLGVIKYCIITQLGVIKYCVLLLKVFS